MIIAIRSESGTNKVDIPDNSIIKDVFVKLKALNINTDGKQLAKTPRDSPLQMGDTLNRSGIKSGDLIYLVGGGSSSSSSPPSSSNSNKQEEVISNSRLTASCKHSENDKCVFCSDAQGIKKCTHPDNTTCPNCQDKKFTGKKLKWLCNHPPGGKCSNCIRVPKKVEFKCNHGPTAVCGNCIDKKSKEETDSTQDPNNNNNNNNSNSSSNGTFSPKVQKQEIKTKCLHGPNARCTNCLPKDDPNEIVPPKRRCKNHGPNGSCIDCIEWRESLKLKLKSQDNPHCPGALVDFQAANVFQQYLQVKKFEQQRCGFLYGNFLEDGTVVVDAIYEPPQKSTKDSVELLDDPIGEKIESLVSMLGLTRVGWIFSHPSRKYIMSASEIIQTAQYQNKYGASFVTLIFSINNEGQGNLEAFQVSDQALKLEKTNEFHATQTNPLKIKLKSPVFEEGTETVNADINFFIVTVPVKAKDGKSKFVHTFPVENRDPSPTLSDLASYKIDNQDQSPLVFFSDFHFLVFLLENHLFDLNTDFPHICDGIKSGKSDRLSGFFELVEAQVGELIGHDH